MVSIVVGRNRFFSEIRDCEDEFIAVDVRQIFCGMLGSNFPDNVTTPAEHETCPLPDNYVGIART